MMGVRGKRIPDGEEIERRTLAYLAEVERFADALLDILGVYPAQRRNAKADLMTMLTEQIQRFVNTHAAPAHVER